MFLIAFQRLAAGACWPGWGAHIWQARQAGRVARHGGRTRHRPARGGLWGVASL